MTTQKTTRLAFIGLKGINDWLYLPGVKQTAEAELVAGVDPSEKARASFAEKAQVPVYSTLSELLAHEEVDGVFIGTPNQFHLPNIREAVAAGLHVAVTKPMGNTVSECKEAMELCRKANLVLQVNQEYAYRPAIATGIELARRGEIGEITMVMAHMGSDGGIAAGNAGTWRSDPCNAPGGCVNLNGVHMFDCANQLLGVPVEVTARVKCLKSPYGIDDTGAILVDYQSGAVASVTVSYASGHMDSIVVCGTTGNLVMTEKSVHRSCKRVLTPIELASDVSSGALLVRQFCDAVSGRKPVEIPGERGMLLVAMNHAAVISSKEKRTVSIAEMLGEVSK